MKVIIMLTIFVAFASAANVYESLYTPASNYKENYNYPPARYDYNYIVKDPYYYVDYGHNEYRYGDNTKGEYFVVLPDGRKQTVTYFVNGDSGYVADVKYYGEPKYDYKPAYKPNY